MKKILFANTDWYLYNFRRSLALSIKEAGNEVLLVSPPGPYGEKLEALGLRWIAAPMHRRSLNPLREVFLLVWLWRLLLRERPDVVHSFTIKCAVYGGLVARVAGIARVNAITGLGYVFIGNGIEARLLRPFVRWLMRIALCGKRARLVLQNPDDLDFFVCERVVPVEQIRLVRGSGVDCRRFTPPRVDGWLVDCVAPRVLLASRLLWDKGVGDFVEAARLLRAEGRGLRFLLAGDPDPGNPASIYESVIERWQREGIIEWLRHVDDMPALYAQCDIVVLPSYREGLPKSLIEAGACARALVATDVPGCREVITDGVDGLLVPLRDPPALARAIARLQDDSALACRLGRAARAKALAEYDERIVIAQTLRIYAEFRTNTADWSVFGSNTSSPKGAS